MSSTARPTPAGLRPAVLHALKGGTAALGWTALGAQAYSFLIYFVAGRPFRPWSFVKIGWLFLLSFSHVGLRVRFAGIFRYVFRVPPNGEVASTVHLAFLSGTALACWLLFRAGRRAGQVGAGSPLARAAAGASVAIPYAAIAFMGSFLAVVRFPAQGVPWVGAVTWEAFVLPLAMAGISGGAGGLLSAGNRGRLARSVGGGWRAFVAAMGLSLVGLLVLGAIYPNGTAGYARFVSGHGHLGPLTFVLQLLALPNHAVLILAPAMGGCDGLGVGGHISRLLCIQKFAAPTLATFISQAAPGSEPSTYSATPWVFWLFLLVPLSATLAGGRWAGMDQRWLARAALGSGAGLVFAGMVAVACWAATAEARLSSENGPISLSLGPAIGATIGLALAWGVLGGALGGATAGWLQLGGRPVPDPGESEPGGLAPAEGPADPEDADPVDPAAPGEPPDPARPTSA